MYATVPFMMVDFSNSFLMSYIKGLSLMSPPAFLMVGALFIFWFSIKSLTAKLALVGGGLLIASIMAYKVNRIENKQRKIELDNKNKNISFSESITDINAQESQFKIEEPELKLSRLFKTKD